MNIDLSRFRVVYKERVVNAISLLEFQPEEPPSDQFVAVRGQPPKMMDIAVLVVNEDGNVEILDDEAWRFQFIPLLKREGTKTQ